VALGTHAIERAGQTWIINQPDKPIDDPNAAPSAMLLLIVLLLVRQTMRHRLRNVFLIGVAGAMLVMTASRSGLLACLTFTMLVLPRARLRWVLLTALAVIAALPLIPEHYWTRLAKTLTLQRGTFEAYTSIIRFHAWKVALAMFRDHPWFGVGYVGISTLSAQYGELRMHFGTAENFYLETAAGMGIPGLIAFVFVLVRLFQMGRVVHRCAPSGTLARAMAQFHAPMIVALLVICITGNQFGGVAPTGQLALWLAMMVRASHLAIEAARPPTGRPALGSGVR
jgi:O-antigen ligase